jgi:hypothetical protein
MLLHVSCACGLYAAIRQGVRRGAAEDPRVLQQCGKRGLVRERER